MKKVKILFTLSLCLFLTLLIADYSQVEAQPLASGLDVHHIQTSLNQLVYPLILQVSLMLATVTGHQKYIESMSEGLLWLSTAIFNSPHAHRRFGILLSCPIT
jgi:hypothetical protein